MTTQLLIYQSAVPMNSSRHAQWSLDFTQDYSFSRNTNSVPLMTVEFAKATFEYPIVFAGTEESFLPAAILGVRGNENLYLSDNGSWRSNYIPAFVRRYPFVFASGDEGNSFTLCIDEEYNGFNQENRGRRLFSEDGQPTDYVREVLKFTQGYQVEFQRTQAFCGKLKELNLLESMQAQIVLASGEVFSLTGFFAINREKLRTLSGETLSDLMQTEALELIYQHLNSLNNFEDIKAKLAVKGTSEKSDNS